jgi:hypothetical protein
MNWSGQAPEHESDHGEADEGGDGPSVALEVARQATVATDPGDGALDDPAFRENDEAMQLVTLDDLQHPASGLGRRRCCFGALIAGIGEDTFDEREQAAGAAIEDQPRAVAILDVGRVDDDGQQQAKRVDENVPLAARDLLARIIPLRVERGAPF